MYINGTKKGICACGRLHVGALAGFLRRERRRLPPPALAAEGAAEGRAAVDAKVLARRRHRQLALTDVARGRRLFDGSHLELERDDVRVQGRIRTLEPLNF